MAWKNEKKKKRRKIRNCATLQWRLQRKLYMTSPERWAIHRSTKTNFGGWWPAGRGRFFRTGCLAPSDLHVRLHEKRGGSDERKVSNLRHKIEFKFSTARLQLRVFWIISNNKQTRQRNCLLNLLYFPFYFYFSANGNNRTDFFRFFQKNIGKNTGRDKRTPSVLWFLFSILIGIIS